MVERLRHGRDDLVWACPECDGAGQLHERQDGSVRCYDCGAEFDGKGDLRQRGDRRGENLDEADRQRFSAGSPERYEGPADGANPGPDPKYDDLTLKDVGLEGHGEVADGD
jgi:hypothetical protein